MEPNEKPQVAGTAPEQTKSVPVTPYKNRSDGLPALRTYQSDIADLMKNKQGTVVQIAAAEQQKNQVIEQKIKAVRPPRTGGKNILLFFIGILLIAIAAGSVGYIIYSKKSAPAVTTAPELVVPAPVRVDQKTPFAIDGLVRDDIKKGVSDLVRTQVLAPQTIAQIYLTQGENESKKLTATDTFFTAIGSTIPRLLLRALDTTPFFGTYKKDTSSDNEFFMILNTTSYSTAFAGMLAWENTMFDDLYEFFGIEASGQRALLFHLAFKDKIIKNQDTRALIDDSGRIVFFYTFLGENKNTLLIAKSDAVLDEVLNRLATAKTTK